MQRPITRGAAANAGLIFHVFAMDSTSTTGAGKASVGFASWACRYIRNGEAISGAITPQDITTIGTYAAPTANTNIRIKAVDNTNMIGVYEVQIHLDWANVTNTCQSLTIYLTASGVAPLPIQIPLRALDAQLAALTAVENADGLLLRNVSNVEASAGEHTLCTVVLAMLETSISGTTLLIKRTNGSTTHATKTLTLDAAANPIIGVA